jgi:hypothetical protein
MTLRERFEAKYAKDSVSGCWMWTGAMRGPDREYGHMQICKGTFIAASRVAWFLEHKEFPPNDIDVCHTCDTPPCVNPEHLFLGTRKDNMQDALAKGRMNNGTRFWSDAERQEVLDRLALGHSVKETAAYFGVKPTRVYDLRRYARPGNTPYIARSASHRDAKQPSIRGG